MVSPHRGWDLRNRHVEDDAENHCELRAALGWGTDAARTERPGNPIQPNCRESFGRRPVGWNRIRRDWAWALRLHLREVLSLDDSAAPRRQLSTGCEDSAPCGRRILLRPAALHE